jgi:hypothetical protein
MSPRRHEQILQSPARRRALDLILRPTQEGLPEAPDPEKIEVLFVDDSGVSGDVSKRHPILRSQDPVIHLARD